MNNYDNLAVFNFGKRVFNVMKNNDKVIYFENVNGEFVRPISSFNLYDNEGKPLSLVNQHFFMSELVNRLNIACGKGFFINNQDIIDYLNNIKSDAENNSELKQLFKGSLIKDFNEYSFEKNKRGITSYLDGFKYDVFNDYDNVSIFSGSLEKDENVSVNGSIDNAENNDDNEVSLSNIENDVTQEIALSNVDFGSNDIEEFSSNGQVESNGVDLGSNDIEEFSSNGQVESNGVDLGSNGFEEFSSNGQVEQQSVDFVDVASNQNVSIQDFNALLGLSTNDIDSSNNQGTDSYAQSFDEIYGVKDDDVKVPVTNVQGGVDVNSSFENFYESSSSNLNSGVDLGAGNINEFSYADSSNLEFGGMAQSVSEVNKDVVSSNLSFGASQDVAGSSQVLFDNVQDLSKSSFSNSFQSSPDFIQDNFQNTNYGIQDSSLSVNQSVPDVVQSDFGFGGMAQTMVPTSNDDSSSMNSNMSYIEQVKSRIQSSKENNSGVSSIESIDNVEQSNDVVTDSSAQSNDVVSNSSEQSNDVVSNSSHVVAASESVEKKENGKKGNVGLIVFIIVLILILVAFGFYLYNVVF